MTPEQFRKTALAIPDAVESKLMGHPDFRIGGKIFATLAAPDDDRGMVKLTPEQLAAFCEAHTGVYLPCMGA